MVSLKKKEQIIKLTSFEIDERRVNRALSERIKLLEFEVKADNSFKMKVRGSKTNVYCISARKQDKEATVECSCPDFKIRSSFCKHLIYCSVKIAKIDVNQPLFPVLFIFDQIFAILSNRN
jgi:uncharacterized Zn finger protein